MHVSPIIAAPNHTETPKQISRSMLGDDASPASAQALDTCKVALLWKGKAVLLAWQPIVAGHSTGYSGIGMPVI